MKDLSKKLFVISGSSGVGKGTVIKSLISKHSDIKLSISCTTRMPRPKEINGVNYFFTTREEFEKSVSNDEFLEWAEFSGNCYGTKKSFVINTLKNSHVLLEIDTQGALQIKNKMPGAILIFIAPPSYEELVSRLRGRHTESEDAINKRLNFVNIEKENSKLFDYIIVNDTVENAVEQIEKIING
ncbi:MAG: guanylate kinase [Candidatus Gastranaerophilales bacterium]|nr:guanylate kinase [Candidatus Gastranaerophilales bacterium]